jgi:integrase
MSTSIENTGSAASPERAKLPSYIIPHPGQFVAGGPPLKRHFDATPCEGPGCKNMVPAGLYSARRTRSFCSETCRRRETENKYVIGTCPQCGGDVLGMKNAAERKTFCCDEHWRAFVTERVMAPTGIFRPLIDEYMDTAAANYYADGTLANVRVSLSAFFRHVVGVERISVINDVRSGTITRFIAAERKRGITSRVFVGHLATFFGWLIAEERYSHGNPVVSRIHSQRGAPAAPRPYNDRDLRTIWDCVARSGKLELMLAFAIGEECGLRVGEVSNIRLSDIDTSSQAIFVRLPTKNNRTRTVPFHDKVKKYLGLWLEVRGPGGPDDHLLLNKASHRFTAALLDFWFKKLLAKEPDPAGSFRFHRLRHSWATRLMNNGMQLAVLKELGGWKSWNSMQRYIQVLDSTVRAQYEASYAKLQQREESLEDEAISLLDLALMDTSGDATPSSSAR